MMGTGKDKGRMLLTAICGLVALVLFALSLRPLSEPGADLDPAVEQGVTLLNSRYEGWEGTKRIWTLEAAEIFRSADGRRINFRGIETIRYYQGDDRFLVINADTAMLDLKRNVLKLNGVRGEINGGQLYTAGLELDLEQKQIKSSALLSFTKEGLDLQASQMEGDLQTEEYRFTGDLEVVQKNHRSRGQTFTYYGKEDRFELSGDVEVELKL